MTKTKKEKKHNTEN